MEEKKSLKLLATITGSEVTPVSTEIEIGLWDFFDLSEIMFRTPAQILCMLVRIVGELIRFCLLYTSPSPRDRG